MTGGHTYCIGGVGETEMFHRANTTCSYLTDKAAESCASYNMLRLTSQLFEYTRSGNLMDYYDNTLRNHILTSSSHKCDGGTTYFLPLGPVAEKNSSFQRIPAVMEPVWRADSVIWKIFMRRMKMRFTLTFL